jgi:PEP-CTERM motif
MKISIPFKSVVIALISFFPTVAHAVPVVFSVGGDNTTASIQATVDNFRNNGLGNPLNPNVAGSFDTGRREINWDGVPDAFSAPNNLPANFFNVNSPRGVVFSTPGTGFQVSGNAGVAPIEFDNINATYSATFRTFSPQRLFTALESNITDIFFFVPGSSQLAFTRGFGAVFTDVDLANTTSIQYFDTTGASLGTFFAPPGTVASESLSFLGVAFTTERVGRVRITSGNVAPGPNDGGATDVVVMDDFLFAEPRAIPEPYSFLLFALGLAAFSFAAMHRLRGIK